MSTIGFYSNGKLVCASSIASAHLEFQYESIADEAQRLATSCNCQIDAWTRTDDGEQANHTGITAQPASQATQSV